MLIWFNVVVMTNSTLLLVVALLGATDCADTRNTQSSETHIASKRRGSVEEGIAAVDKTKQKQKQKQKEAQIEMRKRRARDRNSISRKSSITLM